MNPIKITARVCSAGWALQLLLRHTSLFGRYLKTPFAPIRFALRFGYCFSERFLR